MELLLYFERAGALPWITMNLMGRTGTCGDMVTDDTMLTGWRWRPRIELCRFTPWEDWGILHTMSGS